MKKYIFMFLILNILFIACNDRKKEIEKNKDDLQAANSENVQKNEIDLHSIFNYSSSFALNNKYKDYLLKFEKLKDDEILGYEYGSFYLNDNETDDFSDRIPFRFNDKEYNFELYAENKTTNEKRTIGHWRVPYGTRQFSVDRKSAVFFFNNIYIVSYKDSSISPLFFVDGNKGEIKYLFDAYTGIMTNRTLEYLLCIISGNETGYKFAVVDLKEKKIVKTVEWKVTDRLGGGCRIFRSKDPNYDFRIVYMWGDYNDLFAVCYYNIEKDKLDVIFDNTGLTDKNGNLVEEGLKREEILPEEDGTYKFN